LQTKSAQAVLLATSLIFSNSTFAALRCETCQRDHYGHIQRHSSAKAAFKRTHPCPANGYRKGKCPGYVIDHIKALKRGGLDDPSNMQWQTITEAKAKDKWE
jgi:hypothetical protein